MLVFITLLYFLVNSNAESQHFFFLLLLLCILFSVVTYVTDMTRGKERERNGDKGHKKYISITWITG